MARLGARRRRGVAAGMLVALAATGLTACGDGGGAKTASPVIDPGDGGNYHPRVDPAYFVRDIDNPYLPLRPGSRWVYRGSGDESSEQTEVVVTNERRQVLGVSTVVVRDTVRVGSQLVEDTIDLFAQDRTGAVWYFGEEVKNYKKGTFSDTHGSFMAGVNGARPGIVMPARPAVGDVYRQEYFAGTAEDMATVLRIDAARTVKVGAFTNVVVTRDWTPLTPKVVEEKYYAPGVGMIFGQKTSGEKGGAELIEYRPGSVPT